MTDRQILFLVGLSRSGTTALTNLLNSHPHIALGMERYKRLFGRRIGELRPELFDKARFFDFGDDLTNLTPDENPAWRTLYESLSEKWDGATVVGDKTTEVQIEETLQNIPEAKFLCIIRSPMAVGYSWQARADNPKDPWAGQAGARASVQKGNRWLQLMLTARQEHPDKVGIVQYQPTFGDPDGATVQKALDFMGLETVREFQASYAETHRTFVEKIRTKDRTLPEADRAFIDQHVDWDTWHALTRATL